MYNEIYNTKKKAGIAHSKECATPAVMAAQRI